MPGQNGRYYLDSASEFKDYLLTSKGSGTCYLRFFPDPALWNEAQAKFKIGFDCTSLTLSDVLDYLEQRGSHTLIIVNLQSINSDHLASVYFSQLRYIHINFSGLNPIDTGLILTRLQSSEPVYLTLENLQPSLELYSFILYTIRNNKNLTHFNLPALSLNETQLAELASTIDETPSTLETLGWLKIGERIKTFLSRNKSRSHLESSYANFLTVLGNFKSVNEFDAPAAEQMRILFQTWCHSFAKYYFPTTAAANTQYNNLLDLFEKMVITLRGKNTTDSINILDKSLGDIALLLPSIPVDFQATSKRLNRIICNAYVEIYLLRGKVADVTHAISWIQKVNRDTHDSASDQDAVRFVNDCFTKILKYRPDVHSNPEAHQTAEYLIRHFDLCNVQIREDFLARKDEIDQATKELKAVYVSAIANLDQPTNTDFTTAMKYFEEIKNSDSTFYWKVRACLEKRFGELRNANNQMLKPLLFMAAFLFKFGNHSLPIQVYQAYFSAFVQAEINAQPAHESRRLHKQRLETLKNSINDPKKITTLEQLIKELLHFCRNAKGVEYTVSGHNPTKSFGTHLKTELDEQIKNLGLEKNSKGVLVVKNVPEKEPESSSVQQHNLKIAKDIAALVARFPDDPIVQQDVNQMIATCHAALEQLLREQPGPSDPHTSFVDYSQPGPSDPNAYFSNSTKKM